jgi:hydroxyethylthiazole kinase
MPRLRLTKESRVEAMDIASPAAVARTLAAVRARVPLVHNITNAVVTNSTANALLALGASPAMVEGQDEVEQFAAIADALVVNLGTMSSGQAAAMKLAVAAARAAGKPWVMDPVAVGAIAYRTGLAVELAARGPAVIRGNASEVLALAGAGGAGRGVDSGALSDSAITAARVLARRSGAAVAVTGAIDYITDGDRLVAVGNGHPMMTRVTGLGCTATALTGACIAVESDALAAAAHALVLLGVAGELAAEMAPGPGSLQVLLLDALYRVDAKLLATHAKIAREDWPSAG